MKITDEIFWGIEGLIQQVVEDALALHQKGEAVPVRGMATSITAQICQNLEAERSGIDEAVVDVQHDPENRDSDNGNE